MYWWIPRNITNKTETSAGSALQPQRSAGEDYLEIEKISSVGSCTISAAPFHDARTARGARGAHQERCDGATV
jgi:hypothetical protein